MNDLIAVLSIIVCTEGYLCDPNRHGQLLRQPDFDRCLQNLAAMPRQPVNYSEKQEFAFTASCSLMEYDEYKKRSK